MAMDIFLIIVVSLIALFVSYYRFFKFSLVNDLNGHSKIAETKLGPIEYKIIGDKGPILMSIHGSPGGHDQNIISSDAFRILILSRPGYLRTPLGVGKTPAEQATAYSELLDVLGIQKVVVMGISGGGPSSMEFAAKFPEKTLGLIAFEAVSYSEDYANKFPDDESMMNGSDFSMWAGLYSMSFLGTKKKAAMMLPNPKNRIRLTSNPKNVAKLKSMEWSIWPMSLRREGVVNDYQQFANLSIPFEKINAPTLAIHGNEDINVDLAHARELIQKVQGSELRIIDEGDHMMMFTHAEEIDSLIKEFVLRVSNDQTLT
jgi:pimeloyl-ACP methyl ester carboxylesterase|tara:strand:+ start:135 stop:1082 length:948 start_codon:yes stop_codon:yes gene_type:complete